MPVICATKTHKCCSELRTRKSDWWCDAITGSRWTQANQIRFRLCRHRLSHPSIDQFTIQNPTLCQTGEISGLQKSWQIESTNPFFCRTPSPLPRGSQNAYASPIDSLPHTSFSNGQPQPVHHQPHQQNYQPQQQQNYQPVQSTQPKPAQHVNYPPPPPPRTCFSPQLTRDNFQSFDDENSAIQNQVRSLCEIIASSLTNCTLHSHLYLVDAPEWSRIIEDVSWPNYISHISHTKPKQFIL